MNDALIVCLLESFGDLSGDLDGLIRGHALLNQLLQSRAVDELHDEEALVVCFLEAVDRGNVRMIQRCQNFGLALEPRQTLWILCNRLGKHFDGHVTPELGVLGPIHLTHTAFAELGSDPEVGERRTDQNSSVIVHGGQAGAEAGH